MKGGCGIHEHKIRYKAMYQDIKENAWKLEHNTEVQEFLNRIMKRIISIITSALNFLCIEFTYDLSRYIQGVSGYVHICYNSVYKDELKSRLCILIQLSSMYDFHIPLLVNQSDNAFIAYE